MAEFKTVSGQIEGLWNAGLADAEVAGRKAGEAAGVERAVQAVAVLIGEHGGLGPGAFVGELRRRLSAEVPEILEERFTRAEWEAQLGHLGPAAVSWPDIDHDTHWSPEIEAVRLADAEQVYPPVVDTLAAARDEEAAADAAQVYPADQSATSEALREADLEARERSTL